MNNVFFTGLLQAAKSDKVQFIALAFCLVSVVFYCGFKIIAHFKAREAINYTVFGIIHQPSVAVVSTFNSMGDCLESFEKNYADNSDYYCFCYDPVSKHIRFGSIGELSGK